MSYSRSLIPLMLRSRLADDWLDYDWDSYPSRLVDQHFGQALEDQDFGSFYSSPRSPRNAISQRQFARQLSRPVTRAGQLSGFSEIADDKDQFAVKVDVSHFGPAEITVKAIDGDTIVIEGRHEEKQDQHGYVSRQFSRRYTLPKDVEVNRITSSLTPEGILTVTAPKKVVEAIKDGATVIPVTLAITDVSSLNSSATNIA